METERLKTRAGVYVTISASEYLSLVSTEHAYDEALTLLRAIRQAYCEDAKLWGTPGVGEDDARRFMRAYERLMVATSPALNRRIMTGGAHSGPSISDEQRDDPGQVLGPILGIR